MLGSTDRSSSRLVLERFDAIRATISYALCSYSPIARLLGTRFSSFSPILRRGAGASLDIVVTRLSRVMWDGAPLSSVRKQVDINGCIGE